MRGAGLGLLTTAGTAILAALLGGFTIEAVHTLSGPATGLGSATTLEAFLAAVVTGTGALIAGWYALSGSVATCCTMARAVGGVWRAGELLLRRRGAPGVARLVGAGTGAVLTASLVLAPAQAEPPEPAPEPAVAEDLTWAAAADGPNQSESDAAREPTSTASAEAPNSSTASAEAPPAEDSPASSSRNAGARPSEATGDDYVVQDGDSLWAIAAAHLDPDASADRIAAAWPSWYETNRAAIGADPDLILPGTVLHAPD
ncbi:LysM peptidoglycan-binding domain-containing protein [Ruania zhangjianzhongii]|uniref:LysM peptidoglycan-binding domain-containing protein n=1 Tax=Ruania zhangjianzhongii TaxID=2603206 RepID=UPI0011C7C102|nr:LysM peptidoglycan-binding domain-containing protein [Ruania zhangjianzhongii]